MQHRQDLPEARRGRELGLRQVRRRRERRSRAGTGADQGNEAQRNVLRGWDDHGSARWIDLPRVDEAQPGWPEARGARLSRHFAVWPQPGLEPAARQCARTTACDHAARVQGRSAEEAITATLVIASLPDPMAVRARTSRRTRQRAPPIMR